MPKPEQHPDPLIGRYRALIDTFGWAVVGIFPTATMPGSPFNYTLGLTEKGFPELAIAGLGPKVGQTILNTAAGLICAQGHPFPAGHRDDRILKDFDVVIADGLGNEELHPGMACRMYGASKVRVQQVVWPDKSGQFPWELGYSLSPVRQPLLDQLDYGERGH